MEWLPIEKAPLGEWGLAWHPAWRHPYPAMKNGEGGAVWVDTCEPRAHGWQTFATHWTKPVLPARIAAAEPESKGGKDGM